MKSVIGTLALFAGAALAQRPTNTSICDYYTKALLNESTPANQYTVLTLVVNTAVIGNYTKPNVGVSVPGILANGTYNGTAVSLLKYFDGSLLSTNNNGTPISVNFLDDGGAVPLMMNKPANGTSSAQYQLLTHLYSYFGVLLGCSGVGQDGFPAYSGSGSQFAVHRYMDLDAYEVGWFIQNVGLSAASFGVTSDDVTAVGNALNSVFGYKCAAPATVVPSQGPDLQAICVADSCPLAANNTCAAYAAVSSPSAAPVSTSMSGSMSGSMSATSTGSMSGSMTNSAGVVVPTTGAAMAGATAFAAPALAGLMAAAALL